MTTNDDLIADFSQYQRGRGFSDKTIKRRQMTLGMLARTVEPRGLLDLELMELERFVLSFNTPRTRHAYRSDVRMFYRWALRWGFTEVNPADAIDSIKVPKSLPRPFAGDLSGVLLVGRMRARQMVALGLYAGLRCAEIAVLDASDVMTHTDPKVIVVRNGKGAKDRVVPMHPVLVEMFSDLPANGPLFANPRTGRPIQSASVGETIKRQLKAGGLSGVPHQLRHTFGTHLARAAGGDLQVVAHVMGHDSMETTRGYAAFDGGGAAHLVAQLYG